MNKDQVKGRVDQAKGTAKKAIGKATDDKDMQRKGQAQKVRGKLQAGYGDAKEKIKR